MATVTVQLGQCGNQLGLELLDSLFKWGDPEKPERVPGFFREADAADGTGAKAYARAVMVDMEQKVIAQADEIARRRGRWQYDAGGKYFRKQGSGNNWAFGYCRHGPACVEPIAELIRREVERCDSHSGFLVLQSLAGGTGSGVGAFVSEALREEFPSAFIVNNVVWPFKSGEVIVQNYNALLTLSHLWRASDAVVALENDSIHDACMRRLGLKHASIADINGVMAHHLASVLLPADGAVGEGGTRRAYVEDPLGALCAHLCSHGDYRLLSLRTAPLMSDESIPFSSFRWSPILKSLRVMSTTGWHMEEGMARGTLAADRCAAALLVLRGVDIADADPLSAAHFGDPSLYAPWNVRPLEVWRSPRKLGKYEMSGTLMSNGRWCVKPLTAIATRASSMFRARAYVHQYRQHGLSEDDFVDAFVNAEQIIQNYERL